MAQPDHIEIDLSPARRYVKRAISDLTEANKELARQEQRIRELEAHIASLYRIDIDTEVHPA